MGKKEFKMSMRECFTNSAPHNVQSLMILPKRQIVQFGVDCCYHLLSDFEKHRPGDTVVKDALDAVQKYIDKKIDIVALRLAKKRAQIVNENLYRESLTAMYAPYCGDDTRYRAQRIAGISAQVVGPLIGTKNAAACAASSAAYNTVWLTNRGQNQKKITWDWVYNLYLNAVNAVNSLFIGSGSHFVKDNNIKGLVKTIKESRDFGLMPILFDAIEEQVGAVDRKEPYGLSHWALQ